MKPQFRTASAAVFAAAAIALAFPATASGLPDTPGEWDIGAYDQCVSSGENHLADKPERAGGSLALLLHQFRRRLECGAEEVPGSAGRAGRSATDEIAWASSRGGFRACPFMDASGYRRRSRRNLDDRVVAAK